jgi:phosphogluconate dehydratase
MLSAHQPYARYPEQMKLFAREVGATAQVAGGVPAMCDGVTQGQPGMDLSLFSRDTIALSTAVALSHGMFEAAALLGICDKIVPGLLIGALRFGHLPTILVPAAHALRLAQQGKAARPPALRRGQGRAVSELLEAEIRQLPQPGTCTFYGTANSNPDDDGGDGPLMPGRSLRQSGHRCADQELTACGRAPAERDRLGRATTIARSQLRGRKSDRQRRRRPARTGGSTKPRIHLPAIARRGRILFDWAGLDDALSAAVAADRRGSIRTDRAT